MERPSQDIDASGQCGMFAHACLSCTARRSSPIRGIAQENHQYCAISRGGSEDLLLSGLSEKRTASRERECEEKHNQNLKSASAFSFAGVLCLEFKEYKDGKEEQGGGEDRQDGTKEGVKSPRRYEVHGLRTCLSVLFRGAENCLNHVVSFGVAVGTNILNMLGKRNHQGKLEIYPPSARFI